MSKIDMRLQRLELVVWRRLKTLMGGLHRGYFGPGGFDPKGIRDFIPGDNLKRIHWANSRRRGKLVVTDTEPELSLRLGLVLDLNSGMLGSKHELALRCFSLFAQLGTTEGNQAGALIASEEEMYVRMGKGISHARKLRHVASTVSTPEGTPYRLHHALAVYPTVFKLDGLSVVISDLRSRRWQDELRLIAGSRDTIVIQIVGERELKLEPGTKLVRWRDPIDGRVRTLDGSNAGKRQEYADKGENFLAKTKKDVARTGASHLVLKTHEVQTDEQLVSAIERFLHTRKLKRGGSYARTA